MKVLFVSSGNSENGVSPVVKAQAESLIKQGVEIHFFTIKGRGVKGYLSNIKPLGKFIKQTEPDLIHAHYSLTAFAVSLVKSKPLVVSLMGSDVKSSNKYKFLIRLFVKSKWDATIVKSEDLKNSIASDEIVVIPNGVDTNVFRPVDKRKCQKELGWEVNKTHVLFAANESRPEKQFHLAQEALSKLNRNELVLHTLNQIEHTRIPYFMNAADVILLTSSWEGSPNVIKEAMSCSKPIAATDVGDIKWLFGDEHGHYLSSFDTNDLAQKIQLALHFSEQKVRTNGRERIMELGLDEESVAKRLIKVYQETLKKHG